MVTSPHEASHRIFQDRPELLAPVFGILGVPLPPKATIDVLTPDATEIRPLERRVDSVLRVETSEGARFLLAIEAQGRRDPDKASSWTYYLAYLRAKYELPALLLVLCRDKTTARWAAGPFTMAAEGWTSVSTHPLVLGPGNVPLITDPAEAARNLALATFSALTHGRDERAPAILEALMQAMGATDSATHLYYSEMLEIGLGDSPAGDTWRTLMGVTSYFPGRGTLIEKAMLEGAARGMAEGKAEGLAEGLAAGKAAGLAEGKAEGQAAGLAQGKAEDILRLLDRRGIAVSLDIRVRVSACTDIDVLDHWFDRAITATTADELFGDEPDA
ncbi:hypothetical protein [Streptomyces sp. NPDC090022]|uniref:hypothetical protein n=1 Tax=Streptomyces sp. NPDC090022 TaxID=3365920 RepID=UPI003825764F